MRARQRCRVAMPPLDAAMPYAHARARRTLLLKSDIATLRCRRHATRYYADAAAAITPIRHLLIFAISLIFFGFSRDIQPPIIHASCFADHAPPNYAIFAATPAADAD